MELLLYPNACARQRIRSFLLATCLLSGAVCSEPFRNQDGHYHFGQYFGQYRSTTRHREQFIQAVKGHFKSTDTPIKTLQDYNIEQYRNKILLNALDSEGLLRNSGPDSHSQVDIYAYRLVDKFSSLIGTMDQRGHIQLREALVITKETLELIQLMRSYLPEIRLALLREPLNKELTTIRTMVQNAISDDRHNGLTTPALIRLQALLNSVLSPLTNRQSINNLDEIIESIDSVFISANTKTLYPATDIHPESMIDPARKAELSQDAQCYKWPWPVPNSTKHYLICTDRQE